MKELLLVRHAHAVSNRDGIASCAVPGEGLTPEGVEQAGALAAALAGEDIALAVTSALRRTQETARLALAGTPAPHVVVPELNEIDFGSFDGGSLDRYRAWAAARPPSERAPGGGESRADAAARFARGIRAVLARPEETVLLVGHALALRYVVDAANGLVPAPLMAPVSHATVERLERDRVEAAASLLERWSVSPRFRELSAGG